MVTIKEAFVEIADCNTNLVHLGSAPPRSIRLGTEKAYCDLYQRIAEAPIDYETLSGTPGNVLKRLKPIYYVNRYWHQYFESDHVETYYRHAWKMLVPIEAQLGPRLAASPGQVEQVTIKPMLRVLLYPFGWSTWISLRILGDQTLPALAALLRRLVHDRAFRLPPESEIAQTRTKVLERVAQGVWNDAFGGGKNMAVCPLEVLSVTTVLDKFGGAPSNRDDLDALPLLISPDQPLRGGLPKEAIHALPKAGQDTGNLDYALQNDLSVFLWAEHRLKAEGNNRQSLRCYHNNIFLSLVHAWQLIAFLKQASASGRNSGAMAELVRQAIQQIDGQLEKVNGYRSVSQLAYLQSETSSKILEKARKKFHLR